MVKKGIKFVYVVIEWPLYLGISISLEADAQFDSIRTKVSDLAPIKFPSDPMITKISISGTPTN